MLPDVYRDNFFSIYAEKSFTKKFIGPGWKNQPGFLFEIRYETIYKNRNAMYIFGYAGVGRKPGRPR